MRTYSSRELTRHSSNRSSLEMGRRGADRSTELLPWGDPYILSLFDEHRKEAFSRSLTNDDEEFGPWQIPA